MLKAGDHVDLLTLRGPLEILFLDVKENGCTVLLQEVRWGDDKAAVPPRRTVRAQFSGLAPCTLMVPEWAVNREKHEPAQFGTVVQVYSDSHFLDYLRTGTASLECMDNPRHWRIHTGDGTIDIACDRDPHVQYIPAGWDIDVGGVTILVPDPEASA